MLPPSGNRVTRRSVLGALLGLATGAMAQKAVMASDGQVRVCSGEKTKCPLGHETCKTINASLVVGNNDKWNPNWGMLDDFRLLWCETCSVLFAEKR